VENTLPGKKRRLGEILVTAGLISDLQLKAALAEQRKWGGKLGRTLVEMGFVDEPSMVVALSHQLRLPMIDLDKVELPAQVVQFLRVDIAERYGVFPVGGDPVHRTLQLATSDPTNAEAFKELAFYTGMRVQPQVATSTGIDRAIRRYYYGESTPGQRAAKPQDMGLSERTFDADQLSAKPTEVNGTAKMPPPTSNELAQLIEQVGALERLVAGQVRALRGMLELMVDKGILSRDEYLNKVRGIGE
jgi:type IV pilus assembly protein PilB